MIASLAPSRHLLRQMIGYLRPVKVIMDVGEDKDKDEAVGVGVAKEEGADNKPAGEAWHCMCHILMLRFKE